MAKDARDADNINITITVCVYHRLRVVELQKREDIIVPCFLTIKKHLSGYPIVPSYLEFFFSFGYFKVYSFTFIDLGLFCVGFELISLYFFPQQQQQPAALLRPATPRPRPTPRCLRPRRARPRRRPRAPPTRARPPRPPSPCRPCRGRRRPALGRASARTADR